MGDIVRVPSAGGVICLVPSCLACGSRHPSCSSPCLARVPPHVPHAVRGAASSRRLLGASRWPGLPGACSLLDVSGSLRARFGSRLGACQGRGGVMGTVGPFPWWGFLGAGWVGVFMGCGML